jgi:Na+-driven multidrug efflux pump
MIVFVAYLILDKDNRKFHLFYLPPIDFELIKVQARLSAPIALQSFFGMGSWLLFFALVEDYGKDALAASNAVRVIYLFLGVPTWGMSNATTTIVSQLIGQDKKNEVFGTLAKISLVNLGLTILLSVWILLFPSAIVSITSTSATVVRDAIPLLPLLFVVLMTISVANIYYNGIVGAGAIGISLIMQIVTVFCYTAYAIIVMKVLHLPLYTAWCAEMVYFVLILVASILYMHTTRWHSVDL